jgi:hypothetical protein
MEVKVKKRILFNVIKNVLNETPARSDLFNAKGNFLGHFAEIDDGPIKPRPHMTMQLSTEEPPVEDPEYVPGSTLDLCNAASRMMREVPDSQIEFVYRFLHKLLDMALDKEDEEKQQFISETRVIFENFDADQQRLIDSAATRAQSGESIDTLAAELLSKLEFMDSSEEEIELAITDKLLGDMGGTEEQEPKKIEISPGAVRTGDVIRRKKSSMMLPAELSPEDLPNIEKSEDKTEYMRGYNFAADFDETGKTEEELDAHDVYVDDQPGDFLLGYDAFVRSSSTGSDAVQQSGTIERYGVKKSAFGEFERIQKAFQEKLDDSDLPIFSLMPVFFAFTQDISVKADNESVQRLSLATEQGQNMRSAEKEIGSQILAKYGINYTNSLSRANLLRQGSKTKFPVEELQKSAESILRNLLSGSYGDEGVQNFIDDFNSASEKSGMSKEQSISFMSEALAHQLDMSRTEYDAMPYEEMLNHVLATNFAETVVYNVRDRFANKERKDYQGSNSSNFRRHVTKDQIEEIMQDFLDKLSKKYLRGDVYKVKSGSSFHEYDPDEVRKQAEEYVRSEVDAAITAQEEGNIELDELEIEDESDYAVEDTVEKELSEEEIAQQLGLKLSDARDYETLAPFFGFSSSSGLRQWYLKFAERQFKMLATSMKSSDEDLLKLHKEMLEAVLGTVAGGIQDLSSSYSSEPDTPENEEIKYILDRAASQIIDAEEKFQDAEDLESVTVTVDGQDKPFLATLGGQLIRSINGASFKKALTRLDKSWTEFVVSTIDTVVPGIDNKKASGLAEYWTGKKEKPDYEENTKAAKNLLKFNIGPEIYAKIEKESNDWFEDVVTTEFSQIDDFTGEYRSQILKDLSGMTKNKNKLKKAILSSILDIAEESSRRTAFKNLADMEVPNEQ